MNGVSFDLGRRERQAEPLLLADLLNSLEDLANLLPRPMRGHNWLNAYLLAAGINQIVEDYLHPDPLALRRIASHLRRLPGPLGTLAAWLAVGVSVLLAWLHVHLPDGAAALHWQRQFAGSVRALARLAAGVGAADETQQAQVTAATAASLAALDTLPADLRFEVLRLPSCFRSFDQHPDDLALLVQDFARQGPPLATPLLVVGLRTSGSYLAPLVAACLEQAGYEHVDVLTIRPARWLLPHERTALHELSAAGGLALMVDDPPTTGKSVAQGAAEMAQAGLPAEAIVLLLQVFGSRDSLPQPLRRFRSILLPWEEWSIQRRLEPETVAATLADMIGPTIQVESVEQMEAPDRRWARSHTQGLYTVTMANRLEDRRWQQRICVKGAGLGYFGEHALAVTRELSDHVPESYGVRDGLLYRAWLPDQCRVPAPTQPGGSLACSIASYVVEREFRLPATRDTAVVLNGQRPAWEVASNLLCDAYGRAGMPMRPLAIDRLVKSLLLTERPTVVDGSMNLSHWFFCPEDDGRLIKVDSHERAFSNLDLYCYDPVFDLADAAADQLYPGWPEEVRRAYEGQSGEPVDGQRWLLYQLLHLWDRGRTGLLGDGEVRRASSRVMQDYYAGRYFRGLQPPSAGAYCAFDVDGVLESGTLGFPALTPASAQALQALMAHGYRIVLATGRSLDEVRERCDAYGLAGGVAEYGSAFYGRASQEVRDLLPAASHIVLDRLRAALAQLPGVHVDPDYGYCVRAYRLDAGKRRRGLAPETVQQVLAQAQVGSGLQVVSGEAQTDFVAAGVNKGTGLVALLSFLGEQPAAEDRPLALAVGDTYADLPMLRLAKLACAPAHAAASLQAAGVQIMRHGYQTGLVEAAARLLGHVPGDCPVCAPARATVSADLLDEVLAAQESGSKTDMAWRALRLAVEVKKV